MPVSAPRAAVTVALVVLPAPVLLPDLVGLDTGTPFAQVVAFRPALAAGALALALLVAAAVRPPVPVTAALLAVPVVAVALVVPRAVGDPAPPGDADLVVLTLNAFDGRADPAAVEGLVRDHRPDLVTLVEAGARFTGAVRAGLPGYRSFTAAGDGDRDVGAVSVLVAPGLGEVGSVQGRASLFPYLEITGGGLGELRYVAFHGAAPVPELVPAWRRDLELVGPWCDGSAAVVVTGDFNASLDHSPLRAHLGSCADAAAQTGAGLLGTWPSRLPAYLGAQIDRVLYPADRLRAVRTEVVDLPGSDHRAVVTRLTRPAPG